jgi:hypothetical protein
MKSLFLLAVATSSMLWPAGRMINQTSQSTCKAKRWQAAPLLPSNNQPSVKKGRTIGKDLEPMAGKVWTGANEATTFDVSRP